MNKIDTNVEVGTSIAQYNHSETYSALCKDSVQTRGHTTAIPGYPTIDVSKSFKVEVAMHIQSITNLACTVQYV